MTMRDFKVYILKPAAATNLVTNPSIDLATTGYTAEGASTALAVSSTQVRRGIASLRITPTTGAVSGAYYSISLTSGTTYSFSADVYDIAGQSYSLHFANSSGTLVGSATTWTGKGKGWVRRSVTYTAAASATHRLYLTRTAVASTTAFYTDGWQLEEASAATSYFDGYSIGNVSGQKDYGWNGTAHASTSYRTAQAANGGEIVDISAYCKVLFILGMGMGAVLNHASPTTANGSYYQDTSIDDRNFVLSIAINGNKDDAKTLFRNRAALVDLVKPDRTAVPQPVSLRFMAVDTAGEPDGDLVEVRALYSGGLEGNWQHKVTEKALVSFTAYLPMIFSDGQTAIDLGTATTVSNFAQIGYRDTDGIWKAMGTGSASAAVYTIVTAPDGSVYAGGAFGNMGGVAAADRLARWNGSAWEAVVTGLNSYVYAIAFDAAGNLYVGGSFTNAGGVADANYIFKWDGSTVTALGTGANTTVMSLAFGLDGKLYAGGVFTSMSGVANTDGIAVWDGSTWTALGTGISAGSSPYVNALAVGHDGAIYAGGDFDGMGGVADTANIAMWNGSAWVALGTGMDDRVIALAVASDGRLYAGGLFTTAGGISASKIAVWNGVNWSALGAGADGGVYSLYVHPLTGALYLGGLFTKLNNWTMPDRMGIWTGSTYLPVDVNVQDSSANIYAIAFDERGRMYVGGGWTGTDALASTVTVTNNAGARAYPLLRMTGPGVVWQVTNYTTGKMLTFKNGLSLQAGERLYIDVSEYGTEIYSSWRGNLPGVVEEGSDLDFYLDPGANNIAAFITGTTAASTDHLIYHPAYHSLDGTVWP